MALSEDQRALLGLLLSGDSYERVADVLGTSSDEVRGRAHEAARALEAERDPELPARAVRERLAALEGAPAESAAPVTSARTETGRRRVALWIVAGGATLVLLVVLLVVAIGGSGGDQNISTSAGGQEEAVPVRLSPVGGARASGSLTGRTPIPTAAVSLLPSFDTADLTLTRQREAAAVVRRAAQAGTLPQRVGTSVLRGPLR